MSKANKPYWELDADQLAKLTSKYDREQPGTPGRPLTAAQRARHDRAKRRGRPRVGQGSERVNVTIERGLLGQADALAKKKGVSRAELIALGLRHLVGGGIAPDPADTETANRRTAPKKVAKTFKAPAVAASGGTRKSA